MRRLGLWLLLCCALLIVDMPAWAAPRVEMSVQAANEGRVKQGGWVTLLVELGNQGGEISGQLVVEMEHEMPHPQYVVPYTLPAGGRKRIPVSLEVNQTVPLSVSLYAGEELVTRDQVTLTWLPPQATLVGVLSGDELGIPGLSQLQASGGESAQVVRLSAATFPDRAALLADFDVIALSRFDSSSLSPEQLRALEAWVGRGGTLLLAGGPEWKRTLAPLPASLVPVEVTGVRQVDLSPLGELAGREIAGLADVSAVEVRAGQGLVTAGGVPLITSATAGSGRVLFLAFDPGLNPIVSWPGQAQLFNRLVGGSGRTDFGHTGQDWILREALQSLPDWGLPAVWTVAFLLGGYLLAVGPVNYLVLKRMDKREWSWVSVPILSVLFVGLVYVMGFGRFQPLVSHLITVTELSPGTGSATMTSHVGIYAPSRDRLSLSVDQARLVRPFNGGMVQDGKATARVVAGDRTTVELLNLSNYGMSGFAMEHEITVGGGLELVEATLEGDLLTGRLVNGLNQAVDEIHLSGGSESHRVGRLEPGQFSEPFTLKVGGPMVDPRNGPGRFLIPGGSDENGDRRRSWLRQYLAERAGQRMGGGLLVMGWTEQPLMTPGLSNLGKQFAGPNLLWSMLPLPVGGDSAEIPAGVVLGRPVDPKLVDWVPHGFMLQPGTQGFTLLLPPLDPSRVSTVEVDLRQSFPPGMVKVAIKNQKSGQWLPVAGSAWKLEPWQEFVSPVGLIELQYEAAQHIEIAPPTVTVKGVGR